MCVCVGGGGGGGGGGDISMSSNRDNYVAIYDMGT